MAQTAMLSVPAKSVTTGEKTSCALTTDNIKAGGYGHLIVVFTDSLSKPTKVGASTVVQVDGRDLKTLASGTAADTIILADSLRDATLSIMRSDARVSLCDAV